MWSFGCPSHFICHFLSPFSPTLSTLVFDIEAVCVLCHSRHSLPSLNPSAPVPNAFLNKCSARQDFKRKQRSPFLTITTQPGKSCSAKLHQLAPAHRHTDHPYTLMIDVCVCACAYASRVKDLTSRKINCCNRNLGWREVARGEDRKMKVCRPNCFLLECPSTMEDPKLPIRMSLLLFSPPSVSQAWGQN